MWEYFVVPLRGINLTAKMDDVILQAREYFFFILLFVFFLPHVRLFREYRRCLHYSATPTAAQPSTRTAGHTAMPAVSSKPLFALGKTNT